jgi:RNA polymerase sigma-70 factor, ECF subfamily
MPGQNRNLTFKSVLLNSESKLVDDLKNPKTRDRAFNKLLDLYQERLYWHIRKLVISHDNANDVLQNTFIRVHKGIQKFEGKSALHTWMFRIAYNESIRFLNKNKKLMAYSLEDVNTRYLNTLSQDPYFDGSELKLKLHTIISGLNDKQRSVFQMKYFDDLSFREISEVLQISENTLKSSYYSAVKAIEEKIIL